MEIDRIKNVINRVFEQTVGVGKDLSKSMSTDSNHTYRRSGMNQIKDIIISGYIRPKQIVKGGHKLEVFWTHGGEKLFYFSGEPVLEVPSEKVKDGQIGALTIHDLSAVYIFDYELNRYIDRLDKIIDLYNNLDIDTLDEKLNFNGRNI